MGAAPTSAASLQHVRREPTRSRDGSPLHSTTVGRGDQQVPARAEAAPDLAEKGGGIRQVLEDEDREDTSERRVREAERRADVLRFERRVDLGAATTSVRASTVRSMSLRCSGRSHCRPQAALSRSS
jgi:hypothetical protein